jgi:hypothetical protein
LPQTTPSKLPTRSLGLGASGLLCPSCNGDSFSERSSFKTASEPVLGAASTGVVVDLMSCKRCGADLPAVRGRRIYSLVTEKKLTALVADLEEARRINSEMQGLVDALARRSQSLRAEIERSRAEGEASVLEARVAALRSQTDGLEGRRARLAKTLKLMASRIPAV